MPGDTSDPTAAARQVASRLRAEILSGQRAPGSEVESQRTLADRLGVSEGTMNRELAELARDGLVSMGPGRRTVVLPSYRYRVTITVRRGKQTGDDSVRVFSAHLAGRTDAEISDVQVRSARGSVTVELVVTAANPGRAALAGLAAAGHAAGRGWDFSQATIRAEPAAR